MPKKTAENEEIIEKVNKEKQTTASKKSSSKATPKKGTKNVSETAKNKKTKSTSKAKDLPSKSKKTDVSSKPKSTTKKEDLSKKKKNDEKLTPKEEKTVIEKIKAFIAKIVAMQEEARLESEAEKEKLEKSGEKDKKKKEEPKTTPYMLEYYDLPYRYNETVVKILAQTPRRLFVYWDISDKDRNKYLLAFGERFFEDTYPVLLVHNENMNYTFEVPINDFANSWYLDINDPKSKYTIQLGRKFRKKPEQVNIIASTETENVVLHNDYVPIITSNMLEVPNDHILFENIQSKVLYRNVKTGAESTIDIDNLEFAKRMGHIYSIYDVYKEIYKNEMDSESLTDLLNPSSMSSSKMSSSAFAL